MVEDNETTDVSQGKMRDEKGHLLPGNRLVDRRKKAVGGGRKATSTVLRECISERKTDLIEKALDLALHAKDERVRADATFKLLAYVEGAPPSKTDITLRRGVDDRTPEDIDQMAKLLEAALANQRQLLCPSIEVDNALQE